MFSQDKLTEYTNLVCSQIRWKKARMRVYDEILDHLTDSKNLLIRKGLSETEATEKAMSDTGDAIELGIQLDRLHRPKPQWGMFTATALLLLIGLISSLYMNNGVSGLFTKRLFYTGIGIAGMLTAYLIDFSILGKYPKTVYFSVIILSVASLIVSPVINGASFYTRFLVMFYPLAFAVVLYKTKSMGYSGILICGLAYAILTCLTLMIPYFSGAMLLCITGTVMCGVAAHRQWFGIKRVHGYIFMLALFITVSVFIFINPTVRQRLTTVFNPSLDPYGSGFIGYMTQEIINNSKWIGTGDIPPEYLTMINNPNSFFRTDLLLTAIISKAGYVAFVAITGVFLFFMILGFRGCYKQKNSLGFLISLAVMITFSFQTISYIVFNLGITLFSSFSLPLISDGNTAVIINMVLIGFMTSVFRTGEITPETRLENIF